MGLQVVVWSGMEEAAAGPKVHSGSFLEGSTPWYGWVASAVFWWTVYLFLQLLFADTVNEWNEDRFLVAFMGTYLWFYDHAAGIFGVLMAIGGVIKTANMFSEQEEKKKKKKKVSLPPKASGRSA